MDKNCKPSKRGLRMAMGGAFTQDTSPSALEQRLNARLAAGTLTVRGAGMLSDIENQRRGNALQRYGIDAQSATARMHDATNRYGMDTQAGTARYGVDAQSANARMNDATQRFGINTQAGTARYGYDTQAGTARMNDATQRFGISTQADTSRYGYDTNAATAGMNDATNRYGMDLQAETSRYGYDSGRASSMYGADSNLLSNMWRMANGGEIRPSRLGLRNGGELHAANGFIPGGYAEQGRGIKWLSPYDGIKAQAALADMDLKQDYMRAQTEAIRAQAERAGRGPSQDEVNAAKMADDQARQRFLWEEEDRTTRNKMTQTAFDTKMRNDLQDRVFAAQQYQDARNDVQEQRSIDTIRYGMAQDAAGRAAIAENNRRQDAIAAAHTNVGAGGGNDPYEAQDRARLNERRNMYDKALRGHFNAGGFGAMRPGAASAAPSNFGVPRFGLRNGGDMLQTGGGGVVPGKGKGDKIPAKYEPGEFVVSNDMLAADPALRDYLRELRAKVLAQKGMTPEEADAKAIHMDSEGPGDERGAKDERESKAVKRGFGLRAKFGGDAILNEETDFMPDVMTERLTDEENAALLKKYPKLPSPEPKKELPGLFDSRKAAKKTEPLPQISMSKIAENGYGSDATSGMFDGEQVPTKEQAARIEREYNMGGRAANDAQTSTTKYVDAQGNPRVGLAQWFNWTNGYREAPSASDNAPPNAQDLGARDRAKPAVAPRDTPSPAPVATNTSSAPNNPPDAHLREYSKQVVSDADRAEADKLARSEMLGDADWNLKRLNSDATARDNMNKSWGLRGFGIRVDQGENGPVFSNSNATEKSRYTGANGQATNKWSDTQEYKDSIGRTQKTQALADRMERQRYLDNGDAARFEAMQRERQLEAGIANADEGRAIAQQELAMKKESHGADMQAKDTLNAAHKALADAEASGNEDAIKKAARTIQILSGKYEPNKPIAVDANTIGPDGFTVLRKQMLYVPNSNGGGTFVDPTAVGQQGGGQRSVTRAQIDAAAKAKGITDPAQLAKLYATYGV